jgi:flavin reductase (DIM6/NTAB) family NADH-FMN oxidoreductase RutF
VNSAYSPGYPQEAGDGPGSVAAGDSAAADSAGVDPAGVDPAGVDSAGVDGAGVDGATFRAVMASVAAPVTVVTVMAGERPHGSTVSAFTSLSLQPPMVLVALDRTSDLLRHIRASGEFGVNVLGAGQAALARAFARKGDDKFDGVDWAAEAGVPRLPGSAGWLACAVERVVPGGDHEVVLGRVIAAEHADVPPLTYHQRSFGTHQVQAPPAAEPAAPNVRYLRPRAGGQPSEDDLIEDWFAFN